MRSRPCPVCGRTVKPSKRNGVIPNHYGWMIEGERRKPNGLCLGSRTQVP